MRLQDFFLDLVQTTKQMSSPAEGVSNNQVMDKLIRSLVPGQTLLGEILSNKDGKIEIRLDNQLLLHASLEQDMNLEIGSKMTFQVKNNGKTLTLNPLFTNTATDTTTLKAIEMAGLPVNKQSVELTREFISSGLPIHRQSLTQAYHELTQIENAQPRDIALLHKLGIEVSEHSLNQLENYREAAYQIENASKALVGGLIEMLDQFVSEGRTEQAQGMMKEIWNLLEQVMPSENAETIPAMDLPNQTLVTDEFSKEQADFLQANQSVAISTDENNNSDILHPTNFVESNKQTGNQDINVENDRGLASNKETVLTVEGDKAEEIRKTDEAFVGNGANKAALSDKVQFETLLNDFVREGKASVKQEKLGAIRELLTEKWLQASGISTKDVSSKEKITELYSRLGKLLMETEQTVEQAGGKEFSGFQMIKEFQHNLDFLNQINQFSQFVQLPLYQKGESAHGDLYVFSSKKNLAMKDGKISAYLHLDMAHLGSVGIYVAMEQEKVNTQFMLEDEESLKLIEENIESLTKRLQKRGYQLSYSTQIISTEDKKGIIPVISEQEDVKKFQEFSFDVRA